ncbi:MAG: DNA polymerase III subunit gamma/tau [Pseudomonadota bacterium]
MTDRAASAPPAGPYRVLARKYRPGRFADLIGQPAMVRTLSNAIAGGRLAHAFLLTGVRGVGKTTTARIIARALNCVGRDGKGGPSVDPCLVCEHCVAISEDCHLDVIEMDAASRTGVEDIRELIDGARYRPLQARFKIYIVDEVHMLSRNAFNALLKTLEEPPEHVKFIFATTEIRRVPVTVLSRCQRFDLKRVDQAALARHLGTIAAKEGRQVSGPALALLARAADGSVRDGLSLLDRALAHVEGEVGEAETRDLLGLADRARIFDLFEAVMKGEAGSALALLGELYRDGADPSVALEDLLELAHWLTRLKVAPELAADPAVPEPERVRGRALAQALAMPVLTRTWQLLLKGLGEAHGAPSPLAAAEMLMVRLSYAAELPTPAELVAGLAAAPPGAEPGPLFMGGPRAGGERVGGDAAPSQPPVRPGPGGAQALLADPAPAAPAADPRSFPDVVALFEAKREALLHAHLVNHVHLVGFEPGRIELRPTREAPADLATRLAELLQRWTGRRWMVAISSQAGEPTLADLATRTREGQKAAAATHPLVQAVLAAFPGATIERVRGFEPAADAADAEALSDLSDSEDPR